MSLQDDYFDVAAALEGKPEAEAFDRIWKVFCRLEGFEQAMISHLVAIEEGVKAKKTLDTGKWREWLK